MIGVIVVSLTGALCGIGANSEHALVNLQCNI